MKETYDTPTSSFIVDHDSAGELKLIVNENHKKFIDLISCHKYEKINPRSYESKLRILVIMCKVTYSVPTPIEKQW